MKQQKSSSPAGLKPQRGIVIAGKKVRLREKKLSDVRNDYIWQSDAELARLDAAPLLTASFPTYLLDYTDQLRYPGNKRYPLAVETLDGRHIGNCTCYDINHARGEAQLGIMIGDRNYWDSGFGSDAVSTMVNHIFRNTELKRIYLKTLDWNLRAQKCFRKSGFVPCGQINRNGYSFVVMEIRREEWENSQNRRELRDEKQSAHRVARRPGKNNRPDQAPPRGVLPGA